eukprot:3139141-Pyramimonas_sp.AAC.2
MGVSRYMSKLASVRVCSIASPTEEPHPASSPPRPCTSSHPLCPSPACLASRPTRWTVWGCAGEGPSSCPPAR